MKLLIVAIIALLLSGGLIWLADFEPGFVLLQYGNWSLETSLIIFVLLFVVLVITAYMVLRSFVFLKKTPKQLSQWKLNGRRKNANEALIRGVLAYEEGRWAQAERLLMRHAANSDMPVLHYSTAAKAAQKQEAYDRRDQYLDLAKNVSKDSVIAVELIRTELQFQAEQKQQAIETLKALNVMAPKHPYVLQLLQQGYTEMNQWHDVQAVLPDLRKRHVLPSSEVKLLSEDAVKRQMQSALETQDWDTLHSVWQTLSAKLRHTDSLLSIYVTGLVAQKNSKEAIVLIENFMNRGWSDELVHQYGLLANNDSLAQLAKAETWLKDKQKNPVLLLTLGKLAKENQLWKKAEEYLTASIEIEPTGESYQLLASVLESEGKQALVSDIYKKGLTLMLARDELA